jgi:hypothetical protein
VPNVLRSQVDTLRASAYTEGDTLTELLTETVLEPGLAVPAMEAVQVIEPVLAEPHQPKVSRPGRAVLSLVRSIG